MLTSAPLFLNTNYFRSKKDVTVLLLFFFFCWEGVWGGEIILRAFVKQHPYQSSHTNTVLKLD